MEVKPGQRFCMYCRFPIEIETEDQINYHLECYESVQKYIPDYIYAGIELFKQECQVLRDIEDVCGKPVQGYVYHIRNKIPPNFKIILKKRYNLQWWLKLQTSFLCVNQSVFVLIIHDDTINNLPQSLGMLSNLQYLFIKADNLKYLPESLSNLKKLLSIIILGNHSDIFFTNSNKISPQIRAKIELLEAQNGLIMSRTLPGRNLILKPAILYTTVGYTAIENKLTGIGLYAQKLVNIPDWVFENSFIEDLWLNNNQILLLPENINQLSLLKTISIRNNNLNLISSPINELKELEYLNIGYNALTSLPDSIANLESLEILHADNNHLQKLPGGLGALQNLKVLNLSNNSLITLPKSISACKKLEILNLENNKITHLPKTISKCTALKTLNVSHNQLKSVPAELGQLKNLTTLRLNFNQLEVLPEFLEAFPNLQFLHLNDNLLQQIPPSVSSLPALKLINCTYNQYSDYNSVVKDLKIPGCRILINNSIKKPKNNKTTPNSAIHHN